jgi:hypothetical protein
VLKELKVPAVSTEQCSSAIPEDYDIYLTHDKLCAGYLDNGTTSRTRALHFFQLLSTELQLFFFQF